MPETFSPASHLQYKWNPALITVEEMIAVQFLEGFFQSAGNHLMMTPRSPLRETSVNELMNLDRESPQKV
jgi:hypothetical protein